MPSAARLASVLLLSLLVSAGSQPLMGQQGTRNQRELSQAISKLIENDIFRNAFWGIEVRDLETGRVLFERNAEKSFVPASNTKLYTTAAGLDRLGPDYRYETSIWTDGSVEDGVLSGNLFVRGTGDPSIGGRFNEGDRTATFRAWADSLVYLGIRRIEGDIVGDDDYFDDLPLGLGWDWDDEPYAYSAEIGALVFNENCVEFTIEGGPAGSPPRVSWDPESTSYVTFDNLAESVHPDSSVVEVYAKERGANHFTIRVRVPEGDTESECLAISNPTLFFVHSLRQSIFNAGISVAGRIVDVDDLSIRPDYSGGKLRKLFVYHSPELRRLVEQINKDSNNLYAEQLLKTLGAALDTTGIGSAASGVRVSMSTYATASIDTSRLQLVDGSGLSRRNLVAPRMTVDLLAYMWAHPDTAVTNAFVGSLPMAGLDGTLEHRFSSGGPAKGNAHAKTGHLGNVSTLSGYVRTAGGSPLAFSIMCNNFTVETRRVIAVQDVIVNLLAGYRR